MSRLSFRSARAAANCGSSAMHGAHVVEKKSTTRIFPRCGAMGTEPLLTGCNTNPGADSSLKRVKEFANCFGAYQPQYHIDPIRRAAISNTTKPRRLREVRAKSNP